MSVRICLMYQSLLGIYGDRGNATVLVQRLRWRGIDAELVQVEPGDEVPADCAVYLFGGGEDSAQITALRQLRASDVVAKSVANGSVLLAVCAGYQICGNSFTVGADDRVVEGLGWLDVDTRRAPVRAVGEIVTEWTKPDGSTSLITGFENHGGFTTLGASARPLARVRYGVGNDGRGTEGAWSSDGRILGTYPHGPVLARNPDLADHLLGLALGEPLPPLEAPGFDLAPIEAMRRQRIAVAPEEQSGA